MLIRNAVLSILPLFLLSVSLPSFSTEVYISIDEQGNRVFSDQPSEKSQKHKVKEISTIPAIKIPKAAAKEETVAKDIQYQSLIISSPNPGTTLTRDKLGSFNISASLSPALQPGDEAVLMMNGKEVSSSDSLNWQLSNIDRGEHSLQVIVRDAKSNERKKTSPSIPIYIKR